MGSTDSWVHSSGVELIRLGLLEVSETEEADENISFRRIVPSQQRVAVDTTSHCARFRENFGSIGLWRTLAQICLCVSWPPRTHIRESAEIYEE